MAYALVTHTAQGLGATGGTTTGIDTTGADLIVIGLAYGGNPTFSVSDNKGNTWSSLTRSDTSGLVVSFYYAKNTSSGASHTFTITGGNGSASGFIGAFIQAFSGSNVTEPLDQQNTGGAATTGTTKQTGSVTPSEDNEVIVALLGIDGGSTTKSIDGGFTKTDDLEYASGSYEGGAIAYLIQTSATSANPTWTLGTSRLNAGAIASFKAASGGGGAAKFNASWCVNTNRFFGVGRTP